MIDPDDLASVAAALEDSDRVDSGRIRVDSDGGEVVLRGAVATPEEAAAAALLAEGIAPRVRSELRVDHNLREGLDDVEPGERAVPAEDEVLVGNVDMLAGPDASIESDLARAMEENEPWDPPTEPQLAPTAAEYGTGLSDGSPGAPDTTDPDADAVDVKDYAAADLSAEELRVPPSVAPSLDPDRVQPPAAAQPDPIGIEELGDSPPEDLEPMVEQVPGTEQGPGAVGESTTTGGSVGGVPATETGARGADTAAADPARSTGGTMSDAGTERGPEARDDEALREDFPDRDAESDTHAADEPG